MKLSQATEDAGPTDCSSVHQSMQLACQHQSGIAFDGSCTVDYKLMWHGTWHRFIIMAGDPCQLPPVIASPSAVTPAPVKGPSFKLGVTTNNTLPGAGNASNRAGSGIALAGAVPGKATTGAVSGSAPAVATTSVQQGLARPLLVRLIQLGHSAHLLRRQYR